MTIAVPSPSLAPRRVIVYIDGFNLYYGCLKGTPYKWLDLVELARQLLPNDNIVRIHYFTAIVKPTPRDPSVHLRQGIYLRALATLRNVSVRKGFFLLKHSRNPKVQPLNPVNPKIPNPANPTVEVWVNEEKGSDVNLATQLLLDAFDDNFDLAAVLSNDSDLAWPVRMVRRKFKKKVGVIKPERPASYPDPPRPDCVELRNNATWFRHVEERHLIAAQFSATLTDVTGAFTKPPTW